VSDVSSYTYDEIIHQPIAWAESIAVTKKSGPLLSNLRQRDFNHVVCLGCGSAYYVASATAVLIKSLARLQSAAYPASEFLINPELLLPRESSTSLVIAFSRSGKTTETLAAVKDLRKRGCPIINVIVYPDTPLHELGDININIPTAREIGVAQTRSFVSMYVAGIVLSMIFAERHDLLEAVESLPSTGRHIIDNFHELVRTVGEDDELQQFFFLGSGPRFPLACEASLKLKEISLSASEPFHFLEFRHGPMSMVDERTLIIGLLSDRSRQLENAVLEDMRALNGRTFSLGERDADVSFNSGLPEPMQGPLYMPLLQLLAYYRAKKLGLDPDVLKNLTPYIEIELPESGQ
jgi:glucosamine--fructose-6-phosphate aminotransferase (isomerizing)